MRIRWPRKAGGPRRRLYPSKPGILPDDVPDGQGAGLLVVPNWDGYRLASAARFNYWTTVSDVGGVAPPEADTLIPVSVRLPFKGFGRNPYLFHRDYDSAPVVPEADTFEPFLVRIPFRGLGRSPYLWHRDYDSAPVVSEESTFASFLVRIPFKGFGRNPYLLCTAQDLDAPAGSVEPTFEPFLVRIPFKRLGRNPYLFRTAQDLSAVADVGDNGSSALVVFPNWDGYRLARAGRFYYWTPVQGDSAVAPPAGDISPYFPTYRPRRGR